MPSSLFPVSTGHGAQFTSVGRITRWNFHNFLGKPNGLITDSLETSMHVEGSCHCGAVRFSLEAPVPFMHCYCYPWMVDCFVGCYAILDEEADDPRNFTWLRQTPAPMAAFAIGHYVNEVKGRGRPERFRQCFTEANRQKPRARHDPNGMFHRYLGHR